MVKICTQVPRELLSWEARAPLLLEEILDSAADIICLQEVNRYGEPQRCMGPLQQRTC